MAKKPSLGRQKIKIAKIEIKNHLQVTFSKRRLGLFKKTSELCTLCGIEMAIIVFSPAGKAFSFGHPNVESIMDRFFARNTASNSSALHLMELQRNAIVRQLNLQLTHVLSELEMEKKRGEALDHLRKASQSQCWWEAPIKDLGLPELEQLCDSMEVLKNNAKTQANKLLAEAAANPLPLFAVNGAVFDHQFEVKQAYLQPNSFVHNIGYVHEYF